MSGALRGAGGTGPAAPEALVAGAGALRAAAAAALGPALPGPNATAIQGCAVDTCPPGCLQQDSPMLTVPLLYQMCQEISRMLRTSVMCRLPAFLTSCW